MKLSVLFENANKIQIITSPPKIENSLTKIRNERENIISGLTKIKCSVEY
jgi:hypothetical protein